MFLTNRLLWMGRRFFYSDDENALHLITANQSERLREDLYKEGMKGMIPTIDMIATGRNIIRLREAAGLSVRELQDIFGFATPQAIYKWQHGTALPSIDNLVVLGAVLQVPVDDIIVLDMHMDAQISA